VLRSVAWVVAPSPIAIARKISDDLSRELLRNCRVQAGELAYGYLFFPGKTK
jgi:hypothetical protein